MPPPPPPPPPPLMDDLVEEVLLRLPADSPASLVRAGLVCKRWCHLVSDPGFQHRFREFHRRAPPMLGFLTYSHHDDTTRFVPTSSASGGRGGLPPTDHTGLKPGDSRHGRVFLYSTRHDYDSLLMVVWNPFTGEQLELPKPPPWDLYNWNAAVLCAGGSACDDHLDCHHRGSPFVVVLVGTRCYKNFVCIYSSEADAWSERTFAPHSGGSIQRSVRSTLVADTLYFLLREFGNNNDYPYRNILEYNVGTRTISVVKLPEDAHRCRIRDPFGPIEFTTVEDGRRLGFVRVEGFSRLCIWSREVGEPGWVLRKAIALKNLLPDHDVLEQWASWRYLAGSVEGVGIIFLKFKDELFTIDLRSDRINKVYQHPGSCLTTVPYMNFCTPVFRAPSSPKGTKIEHLK